jgi:putative salt-induced outer membrane protein YdiY
MNLLKPGRWVFLSILWLWVSSLDAQIVNIEKQRISSDTTGWLGSAGFSFSGSKTTKSILSLYANTRLEYKSKDTKDLYLLITAFSLVSGDNEKFSNAGFGHLRYSRKLGDVVRWEVFTQVQYNGLTKIDTRYLAGTGPRIKLTQYEKAKFYLGIAYMYEYQELFDPLVFENNHRMSSYFTFTLLPEETVSFQSTFYVQPLLGDFSDYTISTESNLSVDITRKLFLDISFKYNFDAFPPEGVPQTTYYFFNGIVLEF